MRNTSKMLSPANNAAGSPSFQARCCLGRLGPTTVVGWGGTSSTVRLLNWNGFVKDEAFLGAHGVAPGALFVLAKDDTAGFDASGAAAGSDLPSSPVGRVLLAAAGGGCGDSSGGWVIRIWGGGGTHLGSPRCRDNF